MTKHVLANCNQWENVKRWIETLASKMIRRYSSKVWINRQKTDIYVQKRDENNYRARSAFKLIEIDDKYKLFQSCKSIIDLGASPGAWSQIALNTPDLHVVACDLMDLEPFNDARFQFIRGDFLDLDVQSEIIKLVKSHIDIVLSDMAPSISGVRIRDIAQSEELINNALEFCSSNLKQGGKFVCKNFMGSSHGAIFSRLRGMFGKVNSFKPKSSRDKSSEFFYVCLDKK